MASRDSQTSVSGRCPICGEKAEHAFRPFCSKRCRDVDLARWLSGSYAIAGGEPEADEDGDEPAIGNGRLKPSEDGDV